MIFYQHIICLTSNDTSLLKDYYIIYQSLSPANKRIYEQLQTLIIAVRVDSVN